MVQSFVWRDVSGTVGGGRSDGRWTVVSSDIYNIGTVTITYSIIYKGERDLEIRQTMSRENVEKMC